MLPWQHYPSGCAGMTQQGSEGRRGAGRGSPLGPERDFHTASRLKVLSPGYHLRGDAQPLKRAGRCFVTLFLCSGCSDEPSLYFLWPGKPPAVELAAPQCHFPASQRLPPLRAGRCLLWATLMCPRHHHLPPSCPGLSSSAPGSMPTSARAGVGDRDSGEKPGSLGCRPGVASASQAVHQLCPPGLTPCFLGGCSVLGH